MKILFLILAFVSCKNQSETKSESNKETAELKKDVAQIHFQQTDSIAEQWNFMVFEKGGCLGGEQFVSDSKIKREHCLGKTY